MYAGENGAWTVEKSTMQGRPVIKLRKGGVMWQNKYIFSSVQIVATGFIERAIIEWVALNAKCKSVGIACQLLKLLKNIMNICIFAVAFYETMDFKEF